MYNNATRMRCGYVGMNNFFRGLLVVLKAWFFFFSAFLLFSTWSCTGCHDFLHYYCLFICSWGFFYLWCQENDEFIALCCLQMFFLIIFRVWTRFVPYASLFLDPLFPLNLFMLFWFAVSMKAIIVMIVLELKRNLMILQGLDMEPTIEI